MSVSCIIQARRKSSRLPDKVLCDLGGMPVLEHVIRRCQSIPEASEVVCALVDDPYEYPLKNIADRLEVRSYMGSEHDVLDRYYQAAILNPCDYIMRVTSDCPLLDPALCSHLIRAVINGNYDYGALSGWPHGLDCEVFPFKSLMEAQNEAKTQGHREHVTLWMAQNPKYSKVFLEPDDKNLRDGHRWVLDYPEDFQFLKELFLLLEKPLLNHDYQSVINTIKAKPKISDINSMCIQSWSESTQKLMNDANDFDQSMTPCTPVIRELSEIC